MLLNAYSMVAYKGHWWN